MPKRFKVGDLLKISCRRDVKYLITNRDAFYYTGYRIINNKIDRQSYLVEGLTHNRAKLLESNINIETYKMLYVKDNND